MSDYSELVKRLRDVAWHKFHWPIIGEAANALEAQAREISQYQVDVNEAMLDCKSLRARIAELEEAIEPFRRVKAITSIYEFVPVEALHDEEEFNFKMNGAELKRILAALRGERQ